MLQDAFSERFDGSYRTLLPQEDDCVVVIKNTAILLQEGEREPFPLFSQCPAERARCVYLFSVGEHRFFSIPEFDERKLLLMGFSYADIRRAERIEPRWAAFAAAVAIQLCGWYGKNRYCGRCGQPLLPARDERALCCSRCETRIYPRINPVVIVAVTHGSKLLLTRYPGARGEKDYALVAGFAEIGESIEDTVRREVREETGLSVRNLRFYKSQPWPNSDSLLFGFFCELAGSDAITLQESELAFAGWLDREEIPDRADEVSLTAEMIRVFRQRGFDGVFNEIKGNALAR